jgi:cytochrome c551/c552
MKRISLALVLLGTLFAGTAAAQAGADLLNAKGCLGCHGVAEKKMGPALKDAFGKYRGAEAKLAAALKAGKGHPMPVDVSDADMKAMMAHVLGAAEKKPAAAAAAKPAPNLLESKGCLGCHGVDEKKMGPALKDAFAKYRGAEAKLAAALKAGKGHPMPVDVSEADVRAIAAQLGAKPAAKPAATAPAGAAAPAAASAPALDNASCLGCHANAGFSATGADGKPRSLHVEKERFEHSVHGKRQCVDCHGDITEVPHQPVARRQVRSGSSSSASSTSPAACRWSCTRPSADASTARGVSPCANASAAASVSSCRRPRMKRRSSSRSGRSTASRWRTCSTSCIPPACRRS